VFYIIEKLLLKNGMIANNYTGDARGHLKTNSNKNQMRISGLRYMSKPATIIYSQLTERISSLKCE
jgi:hypothetical protein